MSIRTARAVVSDPTANKFPIRGEHAEHPGDREDRRARANLEAGRSRSDPVEVTALWWDGSAPTADSGPDGHRLR